MRFLAVARSSGLSYFERFSGPRIRKPIISECELFQTALADQKYPRYNLLVADENTDLTRYSWSLRFASQCLQLVLRTGASQDEFYPKSSEKRLHADG